MCKEYYKQPRRLWTEINKALGHKIKSKLSQLTTDNIVLRSPKLIADKHSQHFSFSTTPPPPDLEVTVVSHTSCSFHFHSIKEEEVLSILRKLNTHKATGVDGITASLLKTTATAIAPSITKLFNDSISSGQIPADWKKANVTPVPKTSSAQLLTKFRPISVLPVIAKVYKSLIYEQLYSSHLKLSA